MVGLPAFLVLVRLNLVRWWSAVLVGIGAGVLVSHMGGAGVRHSAVGGSVAVPARFLQRRRPLSVGEYSSFSSGRRWCVAPRTSHNVYYVKLSIGASTSVAAATKI